MFESQGEIGGHANTVCVSDKDGRNEWNIDTGFIVLNDKNYPLFTKFLRKLDIRLRPSDMSFSYTNEICNISYAGTRKGLFPRLRKLTDVNHIASLLQIYRYSKLLERSLHEDSLGPLSISEFLAAKGCPQDTIQHYFIPIASAIWSCKRENALIIPAHAYVRFFSNHGLLDIIGKPQWYTVEGGSREYLRRFEKDFRGRIIKNSAITEVVEYDSHVAVRSSTTYNEKFDHVIVATHANTAARIVRNLPDHKNSILNAQKYTRNSVVLHTDIRLMPPNKNLWASWNVMACPDYIKSYRTYTTYYINRLQRLHSDTSYLVTVNPPIQPQSSSIIFETNYSHPMLTNTSTAKKTDFLSLNEDGRVLFCGAYLGYGFHEDGYKSGKMVAERLTKKNDIGRI